MKEIRRFGFQVSTSDGPRKYVCAWVRNHSGDEYQMVDVRGRIIMTEMFELGKGDGTSFNQFCIDRVRFQLAATTVSADV
jgi:hypothetical protein